MIDLYFELFVNVWMQFEQLRVQPKHNCFDQVGGEAREQVWNEVSDKIDIRTRDQVKDQIRDQISDSLYYRITHE